MSKTTTQTTTKISSEQVRKIAYLSRLSNNLSDEQVAMHQKDLEAILSYVEELKAVDTSMVLATDVFRKIGVDQLACDQPNPDNDSYQRVRSNIIANFPAKRGDLLLLPIQVVE